jgi:DNA (cytosine-5)-methyltransferase 1
MAFNVFSCFSGIEAASVAFEPLGFKTVGLSEVDPFCCELLKQKIPGAVNYGDITKHREWELPRSIQMVCGGPPCQSFSLAGLRKGMEEPRGNLSLQYLSFLDRVRPRWVLIENVLGLLSSNNGQDFGTILGGLAQCGYGFAYAVLDAQHFGVPQRRRRVFIVGHSGGDWKRAGAVLFNSESVFGNLEESRKEKSRIAKRIRKGSENNGQAYRMTAFGEYVEDGLASTIKARDYKDATDLVSSFYKVRAVRRLTPVECERLQGFPDNWTRIAYRNKPPELCPDGPRYKAIGNSWAVPVVRWIGERIKEVDQW